MLQLIQSFVIFMLLLLFLCLVWTWIAVFVFVRIDRVGDVHCGLLVIELDFVCVSFVVELIFEGIFIRFYSNLDGFYLRWELYYQL